MLFLIFEKWFIFCIFLGETVVLIRRVDKNWFEGRIGNRKGIFPALYVEVISEPSESRGKYDFVYEKSQMMESKRISFLKTMETKFNFSTYFRC